MADGAYVFALIQHAACFYSSLASSLRNVLMCLVHGHVYIHRHMHTYTHKIRFAKKKKKKFHPASTHVYAASSARALAIAYSSHFFSFYLESNKHPSAECEECVIRPFILRTRDRARAIYIHIFFCFFSCLPLRSPSPRS